MEIHKLIKYSNNFLGRAMTIERNPQINPHNKIKFMRFLFCSLVEDILKNTKSINKDQHFYTSS